MKTILLLLFITGAYTRVLKIYPEQLHFDEDQTNRLEELPNVQTPVLVSK